MKRLHCIALILVCISISGVLNAGTMVAKCTEIKGPETYYYSSIVDSGTGKKLNQFDDHATGISNTYLAFMWEEEDATAHMALSKDPRAKDLPWVEILLLHNDNEYGAEQLTFVGLLNGAPIALSIYPRQNAAIFSQHSTFPATIGQGVRAFMFHAKCNISIQSN